uniref:Pectinesterase catalytic domain-containing protein n=1 Tax=Ananas comosus var. bracteatus TaxID=296719 RepID=A0A6V7P4B3_ANACO|nr:unnamed protein product [Ananas comosus var. bracteatus]
MAPLSPLLALLSLLLLLFSFRTPTSFLAPLSLLLLLFSFLTLTSFLLSFLTLTSSSSPKPPLLLPHPHILLAPLSLLILFSFLTSPPLSLILLLFSFLTPTSFLFPLSLILLLFSFFTLISFLFSFLTSISLSPKVGFQSGLRRRDQRLLQSDDNDYDDGNNNNNDNDDSDYKVITVAKDGTGNFSTIANAVAFAPNNNDERVIITVAARVYEENVEIATYKTNIVLIRAGRGVTVMSGKRSAGDGWTTFRSATGCSIIARKPISGQSSVVTTQSRDDPSEDTGISIQNCSIIASDDLRSSNVSTRTYLGRPWRPYSRTVYIESYIDSFVDPAGWTEWPGNQGQETLYYGEYMNSGPGSGVGARVTWHGYHVMGYNDATNFSVSNFIYGDEWLDSTSFPYDDDIPQLRYIIYTKKSVKTN